MTKSQKKNIIIVLCSVLALTLSILFTVVVPSKRARADDVALWYDYTLSTKNTGIETAVNVSASKVDTTTSVGGQELKGVTLSSDTVYHSLVYNQNTSNPKQDTSGNNVYVDGYQMPHSQSLTFSINDVLDLEEGIEFLMSPIVTGAKDASTASRFVMALSDGVGTVEPYTNSRQYNGFHPTSSGHYISWEFGRGTQYTSYDERTTNNLTVYEGINTTASKAYTNWKGLLVNAFYGDTLVRNGDRCNGSLSLVKVTITSDGTNLSVNFTHVFKNDLDYMIAGHSHTTNGNNCSVTKTYALSDIGFDENSEIKLYFGYYNTNGRFSITDTDNQAIPMSLSLYNFKNGKNSNTITPKNKAVEVSANDEIDIRTLYDYVNVIGNTPTFSYTSSDTRFAAVDGNTLRIADLDSGDATLTISDGYKTETVYIYAGEIAPFAINETHVSGITFGEDSVAAEYGLYGYRATGDLVDATAGNQVTVSFDEFDISDGFSVLLDTNMDTSTSVTSGSMSKKRIMMKIENGSATYSLEMAGRWNGDTGSVRVSENGTGLNTYFNIGYNLVDITDAGIRSAFYGTEDYVLKFAATYEGGTLGISVSAWDKDNKQVGSAWSYTLSKTFTTDVTVSVNQYLSSVGSNADSTYAVDLGVYNFVVGNKKVAQYSCESVSALEGATVEVKPVVRYYTGIVGNEVNLSLASTNTDIATVDGMEITFVNGGVGSCDIGLYVDGVLLGNFTATIQHTYGSWIAEVPATCESTGTLGHYHCSVCDKDFDTNHDELDSLTISATGHTYGSWIDEISATCESTGTLGHYHCSVCGKDFDTNHNELNSLTISALGHDYQAVAEVSATCETTGVSAHYKCSRCDKVFTYDGENYTEVTGESLVISATGHTYSSWIAEVPATCTVDGTVGHYHCSVCGKDFDAEHEEIDDLTIAAAHTYGEWIAEVPAQIGVAGTLGHYHCSACGKDFDTNHDELNSLVITALNGIRSASLSLNGDIGINFYVYLNGASSASGTFDGNAATGVSAINIEGLPAGVQFIKFTFNVAPKDYQKQVTFAVNDTDITAKYSVSQYIDYYLANTTAHTNAYDLVDSLKTYCESARAFFATSETPDALDDLTEGESEDFVNYKLSGSKAENYDGDVVLKGATLVLETETAINIYFKTSSLDGKTFTVNGENVTPQAVANYEDHYVIKIADIAAKDLNRTYTIVVDGYTINYSALSYAYAVVDGENGVALTNVAKALYRYSVEADAYFGA